MAQEIATIIKCRNGEDATPLATSVTDSKIDSKTNAFSDRYRYIRLVGAVGGCSSITTCFYCFEELVSLQQG